MNTSDTTLESLKTKRDKLLDDWLETNNKRIRLQKEIKSLEAEMRKVRWEQGDLNVGDPVCAEGEFTHGDSHTHLINPAGKIIQIRGDDVLVELEPWYVIPRNRWFKVGELELWEGEE